MIYAVLENNVVVKVIASSTGKAVAGLNAVACDEHRICINDTCEDGRWYRDGKKLLTPYEEAMKRIAELEERTADQAAALTVIYEGTMEVTQ